MNTTMQKSKAWSGLALLLSLAALTCATPAHALDFFFGFGPRRPVICVPAPVVVYSAPVVDPRQWMPAHYELQTQTVLVEPARVERQLVAPVSELHYDLYRRPYTVVVRAGYYSDVRIPARYETRTVRVLVPGYYVG